jgi:hypothetical protein
MLKSSRGEQEGDEEMMEWGTEGGGYGMGKTMWGIIWNGGRMMRLHG